MFFLLLCKCFYYNVNVNVFCTESTASWVISTTFARVTILASMFTGILQFLSALELFIYPLEPVEVCGLGFVAAVKEGYYISNEFMSHSDGLGPRWTCSSIFMID